MKLCKENNILIVGLGLMGASYAKALKKRGFRVNAITRSEETIHYALQNNIIDAGAAYPDETLIASADLIIFALYPRVFVEWVEKHRLLFKRQAVITDVTGVKTEIVYRVQEMLPPGVEFIASHPMAGKETGGIQNSDDAMFCKANFIVTPTEKNTESAVRLCVSLGQTLGFHRVTTLSPEEHDEMIAFVSQLTHVIAVSLMCANGDPNLKKYTGDSFRDLTRIAKIEEKMWSELFMLNRAALLRETDSFIDQITKFRNYLEKGDEEGMKKMMVCSTKRRRHFDAV